MFGAGVEVGHEHGGKGDAVFVSSERERHGDKCNVVPGMRVDEEHGGMCKAVFGTGVGTSEGHAGTGVSAVSGTSVGEGAKVRVLNACNELTGRLELKLKPESEVSSKFIS